MAVYNEIKQKQNMQNDIGGFEYHLECYNYSQYLSLFYLFQAAKEIFQILYEFLKWFVDLFQALKR